MVQHSLSPMRIVVPIPRSGRWVRTDGADPFSSWVRSSRVDRRGKWEEHEMHEIWVEMPRSVLVTQRVGHSTTYWTYLAGDP